MSEELTLTGATLTSDTANASSSVEMTTTTGTPAVASSHSHSSSSCCSHHPVLIRREPPKVPSIDELVGMSLEDAVTCLQTLVRQAHCETTFAPLLTSLYDEGHADLADSILNSLGKEGHSFLHWAAKRTDDISFLQLLCDKVHKDTINIASSDAVGMRALHWCCTEGSIPHAAVLLKAGADLELTDNSGCTPLLIAAQYGHVDLVAFLLQRGANGTATDNSRDTALHWAAYKGSITVCGLLLFRGELTWTMPDAYGQTPLHLAALRGHTTVVRYLLSEATRAERRQVLTLADKNNKTPYDLAMKKNRRTVAALLSETMEQDLHTPHHDKAELKWIWKRYISKSCRQFFSVHSWSIWMGCGPPSGDEVDEAPRLPFYWVVAHLSMHLIFYFTVFLPLMQTSQGVLWDKMAWHGVNAILVATMWFSLYKTYTTNPGTLDDSCSKTPELRRLYEQTLESYSDEAKYAKNEISLCHTCHIAKPLRSKHCRIARRCVLMFDHYCPFVGNTIGLYNYKWFYSFLLSLTLVVCMYIGMLILYVRRASSVSWSLLAMGIYLSLYILPSGGMLIYHTQLSMVNLTTNEHLNVARYSYLVKNGQYRNPFFRGLWRNLMDRFTPTERLYTLPGGGGDTQSLLQADNGEDII